MEPPLTPDSDGRVHPSSEQELVALVRWAYEHGAQLRVRGSGHSFPPQIRQTDAPGEQHMLDIAMDRYTALEWVDRDAGIIEAEAGCHLARDPHDPLSSDETGLLKTLDDAGWALSDLGGITHQTVSGFLSTGSAGGSIRHGIEQNVIALRIVDGRGEARWVERKSRPDDFAATAVAMGLYGIISRVRFQAVPRYNIMGQEAITTEEGCRIDLFGDGDSFRPSLQRFLEETEYTRLMWWPQKGLRRVVVWEAQRIEPTDDFEPIPYKELGDTPVINQALAAVLLTILGNLDEDKRNASGTAGLRAAKAKLEPVFETFDEEWGEALQERFGWSGFWADKVSDLVAGFLECGVDGLLSFPFIDAIGDYVEEHLLDDLIPTIFDPFVPLDDDARDGQPQTFQNVWWRGLPMDNGIDDTMMPTWFTEIFIPIGRTAEVMRLFREHFEQGGIEATGTFAFEIYASKRTDAWMHASHGQNCLRMDAFWYGYNAGDPCDFFQQYWDLLRDAGIPFRLHPGKYWPHDPDGSWASWLSQHQPRWDDFIAKRAQWDPRDIFLNAYWRQRLALRQPPST